MYVRAIKRGTWRHLQKWYAHFKNNCTDWVQKCQHHPSLLYQNIQFCSVLMAAKIQNDCYKIGIQFKVEYADAKENSKKFVIISPPWNCTILCFFSFCHSIIHENESNSISSIKTILKISISYIIVKIIIIFEFYFQENE